MTVADHIGKLVSDTTVSGEMSEKNLSKSEMARRMATSRSALDRLLDPSNASVTLQTLQSAAQALGGRLKVDLDFHHGAA
jgi:transcriptional regulator with XRE-family HTH domain